MKILFSKWNLFFKIDGLMNEKKIFQLNVLHYIFYSTCTFFYEHSQHSHHSLQYSFIQKQNVQKMYLSSCLIKFRVTKLNSQTPSTASTSVIIKIILVWVKTYIRTHPQTFLSTSSKHWEIRPLKNLFEKWLKESKVSY